MSVSGGPPSTPVEEVEERVGPYRLIRRLGQGGMGVVYLAESPERQEVALKVLRPHIVGDDERWAMSPGYTIVPLSQPNQYTTTVRIAYPDGSYWQTITIVELRDDKVYRLESYFAPELPAPLSESVATFPHG